MKRGGKNEEEDEHAAKRLAIVEEEEEKGEGDTSFVFGDYMEQLDEESAWREYEQEEYKRTTELLMQRGDITHEEAVFLPYGFPGQLFGIPCLAIAQTTDCLLWEGCTLKRVVFSVKGIYNIAPLLYAASRCRSLELLRLDIRVMDEEESAKAMVSLLRRTSSLTTLDVVDPCLVWVLPDALRSNRTLTRLYITRGAEPPFSGPEYVWLLAGALAHNNTLVELGLALCEVQYAGADALAAVFEGGENAANTTLQTLWIPYCRIGIAGVIRMAEAMSSSVSLTFVPMTPDKDDEDGTAEAAVHAALVANPRILAVGSHFEWAPTVSTAITHNRQRWLEAHDTRAHLDTAAGIRDKLGAHLPLDVARIVAGYVPPIQHDEMPWARFVPRDRLG